MNPVVIKTARDKAFLKTLIDEAPLDGSKSCIVKNTDLSPTAKQRHLNWLWCDEVAKSGIGQEDTKEGVHTRAKWMFARPILLRDDEVFPIIYESFIETVKESLNYAEYCRVFSEQYISTEKLTRAQRAEYLTEFKRYWNDKGIELTDPALQGVDLNYYLNQHK